MFTKDNWGIAVTAAAKVIHAKRGGIHRWGADEIAEEALSAALVATVRDLPTVLQMEATELAGYSNAEWDNM